MPRRNANSGAALHKRIEEEEEMMQMLVRSRLNEILDNENEDAAISDFYVLQNF